jgi:hypothetical protein
MIKGKIQELLDSLQKGTPQYEGLLYNIHVNLQKDPDVVHLLSPEEIGVIVAGLSKKTGVFITVTSSKTKTSSGKKLKDLSLSDL